jgi:ABC-type lipoprotein export system ATPase subunit
LDVFGMVTVRAVLLDSLALEANLAVPLTLSIDPISAEVRTAVEALAAEVGLETTTLPARVGELSEASRMRVHLARALALSPQVLLLEHPTARLDSDEAAAFGRQLAAVADRRKIGWLALTADDAFAQAAGGRQCQLQAASGQVRDEGGRRWGWFK